MAEILGGKKMTNLNDENAAEIFQEGAFEIKTQAEIPVISKQARIVEEVVIRKEVTEHTETVRDSVKRTDVQVEEFRADEAENRRNG